MLNCLFIISNNNTKNKRGQSLRLRFPGIAKHPNCFERVMCPRICVSIHLYSCSFLLFGDFGKQDRKADAISMSFYSKLFHRRTYFVKLGAKIQKFSEIISYSFKKVYYKLVFMCKKHSCPYSFNQ